MTNLIIALAGAHRELLCSIAAGGDEKTLSATARKIEATLITALKAEPDEKRAALVSPLMNSGSLKALKLAPVSARPPRHTYREEAPDTDFILEQPPAYLREAQKRGFTISSRTRLQLLQQVAESTSNHERARAEALLLQDPVDDWMMSQIVKAMSGLTPSAAAQAAPAAAKLLKAGHKACPEHAEHTLALAFCIHEPAAAHEHLFRVIALYALLGAKAPKKDEIEHDDMARLAKALFSRDGRRDLMSETGGLEAYLASGLTLPIKIVQEFEAKRRTFRAPGEVTRRGMFR